MAHHRGRVPQHGCTGVPRPFLSSSLWVSYVSPSCTRQHPERTRASSTPMAETLSPLAPSSVVGSSPRPKTPRRQARILFFFLRLRSRAAPAHGGGGRMLAVLLLLTVTACCIISGCDVCHLSIVKRLIVTSCPSDADAVEGTVERSSPSTTTETSMMQLTDNSKGAATGKADKYVEEFYKVAGHLWCPQSQRYTQEEVAQHKTKDDLWIVVDGNVLNVSAFVPYHPGGDVILDGVGGKDMAAAFAYFHSPSTVRRLKSFCIGRLLLQ
ncbi:hypothetical protein, conserved [Leishmania tarentolae]|uniref:Cytochrome b5 heme-binding domain-containing protein n=1 Tax=Leishmania tarentolae TaxID=5689 RepID=A0A640KER8_LEITA|nr:hypothetical protein, conserved [Leishmania tarentolae]